MHSKEIDTSAGSMDTLRKNVVVRTKEEQRSLDVHNVERNIMDSVGQGAKHHPTKIHRKEDGKETEKETAREPRKVESSKVEKAETKGKEEVKERKNNVSTKSQNHQRHSGQVDLGNNGQTNLGAQKPTLRVGATMIGTLQTSAAAEEFQRASVGDLRLSNLGFVKHIESSQHDRLDPSQRTITFGIDTAACTSPCSTWIFGPQRLPTWMCVQYCRPRQSV